MRSSPHEGFSFAIRRISARNSVGIGGRPGLLAIGEYATLAWMPSVLSRRFALPLTELGEAFGIVTAIAGVLGCLLGGVGSDAAALRYGTRGRLLFALAAASLACIGAVLISSARVSGALLGLGVWTLCQTTGAISGIAAIQSLVPSEYRGVGIALVAFCDMLLGLGFGPTLVALITERVYQDPLSVGSAITATALPAGAIAAMLFLYASRATMSLQFSKEHPS
jgi:MFS family permease